MPFEADTRCPPIEYSFNVSYIAELLEDLLEMDYIDNEDYFWGYVETLESMYPNIGGKDMFDEWFMDNYNNVYCYDEMVDKCFTKREDYCPQCGDGLMQDSSHPYCEREGCYDGVAEARLKKETGKN